jgi:hypothetical protein
VDQVIKEEEERKMMEWIGGDVRMFEGEEDR